MFVVDVIIVLKECVNHRVIYTYIATGTRARACACSSILSFQSGERHDDINARNGRPWIRIRSRADRIDLAKSSFASKNSIRKSDLPHTYEKIRSIFTSFFPYSPPFLVCDSRMSKKQNEHLQKMKSLGHKHHPNNECPMRMRILHRVCSTRPPVD